MFAYIVRRILQAIAVVFVISIVVFILVRCLPGDPIEMYVSQAGLTEITPEMIEEIRHDKGLDRPWVVQYVDWLGQMLRGDFGVSIMRNFNIANEMQNRVTGTPVSYTHLDVYKRQYQKWRRGVNWDYRSMEMFAFSCAAVWAAAP